MDNKNSKSRCGLLGIVSAAFLVGSLALFSISGCNLVRCQDYRAEQRRTLINEQARQVFQKKADKSLCKSGYGAINRDLYLASSAAYTIYFLDKKEEVKSE